MVSLIGRDTELASLLRVLDPGGPRSLALRAPPGMGKTSVWEAFVESARQHPGVTLLRARPLESEAGLTFSGITDLLSTLPVDTYDDLPPPQRSAIRAVLMLDDDHESDPRAVAAALRTLVTRLAAEQGALLLAVDDAQWFDDASVAALSQALARVGEADVLLVAAARPARESVEDWLAGAEQVILAPLGPAEIFHIVRAHTGRVLDRGQLRHLAATTGGNPLHALEVVRSDSDGGSVEGLVTARLQQLPRPTRRVLLVAALAATPTVEVVARACSLSPEDVLDLIDPARADGLVRMSGNRIGFDHPLHLAGAIDVAADVEVRAARLGLAEAEPQPEAGVRHRGLASSGPDAALAGDLAQEAQRAWSRGGWDQACDLMELAVARTPQADAESWELMLTLGEWLHRGGRPVEAEHWLRAARGCPDPVVSARASMHLCQALIYMGRREETWDMIRELLALNLPPMLACEVEYRLGRDLGADQLDDSLAVMRRINQRLEQLPSQPGLAALRAETLSEEARLRTFTGHPEGDILTKALELEWEDPPAILLRSAALGHAQSASQAGRFEQAREEFDALLQLCVDRGDDFSLPVVSFLGAYLDYRAGRWEQARRAAGDAEAVADGQGQVYGSLLRLVEHAVAGLQGETDAALQWLLHSDAAESVEAAPFRANKLTVTAHLLLMLERHDEAWASASQAHDLVHAIGWRDPEGQVVDREFVEAAIVTGRTAQAREALDHLRVIAHRMGNRQITLITCQRLEVQLLAAEGDPVAAVAAVPAMVAAHRVKTVEAVLSTVYRKLGVRSRAQLTSALEQRRAGR